MTATMAADMSITGSRKTVDAPDVACTGTGDCGGVNTGRRCFTSYWRSKRVRNREDVASECGLCVSIS